MEDRLDVVVDDLLSVQLEDSNSPKAVNRFLTASLHIECKLMHPITGPVSALFKARCTPFSASSGVSKTY